jgi:hypothetical protein
MTEIANRPGQEPEPWQGPSPQWRDILYCENTGCLTRRRRRPAAVTLLSIWSGALTLSCDECARSRCNHQPGDCRLLPLSEYRDWYAEARSQMQDGVIAVTAEVVDDGSARVAAPSPAPVVPQAAAISAGDPAPAPAPTAGGPPPGRRPGAHAAGPCKKSRQAARKLLALGAFTIASWVLGIFLISWGNHLAAQNYDYDVAPWGTWGAFFLALPLIVGAAWLLAAIVRAAAAEHRRYRA